MKRPILLSFVLTAFVLTNCNNDDEKVPTIDAAQNSVVLNDFSIDVAGSVYFDLAAKTTNLQADIIDLTSSQSAITLAKCQADWKAAREVWEQSEAHLFGPVATAEIDPRIDTWPVNFTDLDAQLASANEFTDDYINGLDNALKGR